MEVSVIIPVYNVAHLVMGSVQSALGQKQVKEVILIEDGSTDDSLSICQSLELEDSRVKLYQHPDQSNHGAGASRNLGIEKSTFDYIAFLDADDKYLENRFEKTREVFDKHPVADGVYEAVTRVFAEDMKDQYYSLYQDNQLITMNQELSGDCLFESFLTGQNGWFSLDGLTVKRSILLKTGLFDVRLRQAEDTDLILRLCLTGNLLPGELKKPVSIAFIHGKNQILNSDKSVHYRYLLFRKWFEQIPKKRWSSKVNRHLTRGMLYSHPVLFKYRNISPLRILFKFCWLTYLMIRQPSLLTKLL